MPQRASSTASSMASRPPSQPTTVRRGVPRRGRGAPAPGSRPAAAACPRCRRRPPSRAPAVALGRGTAPRGWRTSARPGVGHLEDADLVGRAEAVLDRAQDAELVAALALEVEHRVDHVLEHARAGDLPVLGDVADQDAPRCRAAWRSGSARAPQARTWVDRAGRASTRVEPHGLDRIDDDQVGRARLPSVVRMSRRLVSAASCTGASARPRRCGAQPDLRDRLLAGDVDARRPPRGERRGGLQQQRRLADAGIAADEQRPSRGRGRRRSTRSSSAMPESGAAAARALSRRVREARVRRRPCAPPRALGRGARAASSTMRVPAAAGLARPAHADGRPRRPGRRKRAAARRGSGARTRASGSAPRRGRG